MRRLSILTTVSETTNATSLQRFIEDLVKEPVKELNKQGLARNLLR